MGLLPQAIFGPLGGTIADRFNRRIVMVVADAITAACMAGLVLLFATDSVQLWHVYVLMFVRSSMQAFQAPAAAASTANLVPQAWLPRVAGMNQSLQGVMTIASAPLGALALAVLPLEGALLIDVATAVLGIVPLFFYAVPQPPINRAATGFWTDFRVGVAYVAQNRGLLTMFALLGLVVLAIMPTFTLVPLLVKQHFGGGVNQVALMEGLAGLGMILGGVIVGIAPARRPIVLMLVSFVASCLLLAVTGLAPRDAFWLAVTAWMLSGLAFSTGSAPITAVLQTLVPNAMQGRVLSLMTTVMGVAGPIGLAIAGPLGEAVGVNSAFVIGGFVAAGISALAFLSKALLSLEQQLQHEGEDGARRA
jgi:DHA3 family macrolide efflux protein-like MFS transporter